MYARQRAELTVTNGRVLGHLYSFLNTAQAADIRRAGAGRPRKQTCSPLNIPIFPGAHAGGATPVPIPNTVVKPAGPMVVLLARE